MRISIHRALGELKTLEKRFTKEISNTKFIGTKKNSAAKEYSTGLSVEEFEADIKSKFESVNKLMNNKQKIKEAVVNSNAMTIVIIAGKEMTVASAIEKKESIMHEKALLNQLKIQYIESISSVQKQNDKVDQSLDDKIGAMLSGDNAHNNEEMVKTIGENYRKDNGWKTIDPLGLKAIIEKMETEIMEFENDVDVVLSESNATTFIEIED